MPETYKLGEERIDREDMLALLDALQVVSTALRRDECGAWRINGNHGHILSWGDRESFLLYSSRGSARKWTFDKQELAFCEVTQDGDAEGCLRLTGLPSPEQAEAIRSVLGIRKRPEYTPEQLQARRDQLEAIRKADEMGPSGSPTPDQGSGQGTHAPGG